MGVKKVFWNDQELRARAGWRLIGQIILVAVFTNLFLFVDKLLLDYLPSNPSIPSFSLFQPVELLLAIYLSMLICAKYLDKRPFSDFGFVIDKKWFVDLGAGMVIGIILMTAIFAVEYYAGWITITSLYQPVKNDFSFTAGMLSGIIMFLCVGFYEEMQVRGYILKNLSEGFNYKNKTQRGIVIALVVSSFIFGFGHAANPNATLVSSISIVLAGVLLAAGYLITGRLAIPIGLHISWNFFQGYIYGFPVSGNTSAASVFVIKQGGSELWTGGAFGPEAGLIGVISYFVGVGLIILWVKYYDKKTKLVDEIAEYKIHELRKLEEVLN